MAPIPTLKPGRVIRVNLVTFSLGHPGLTRFTNYPGLTRIGSREKQNCLFDDVETYKYYRVALHEPCPLITLQTCADLFFLVFNLQLG